jgi:hypothetical protein
MVGKHDDVAKVGVVAGSSARHRGRVAFRGPKAYGTMVRARPGGCASHYSSTVEQSFQYDRRGSTPHANAKTLTVPRYKEPNAQPALAGTGCRMGSQISSGSVGGSPAWVRPIQVEQANRRVT